VEEEVKIDANQEIPIEVDQPQEININNVNPQQLVPLMMQAMAVDQPQVHLMNNANPQQMVPLMNQQQQGVVANTNNSCTGEQLFHAICLAVYVGFISYGYHEGGAGGALGVAAMPFLLWLLCLCPDFWAGIADIVGGVLE